MQPEKNLVEEALIQMKQIEDVLAENAKGILSSTMKEEIKELVKESLNEQEDIEDDETDLDMDDEDEMDMEDEDEMDMDDDVIDMRGASQSELLKVFKAMDDEDGIIISKDGNDISLTDEDSDSEYLIKLGEQIEDFGSGMDDDMEYDAQEHGMRYFNDDDEEGDFEPFDDENEDIDMDYATSKRLGLKYFNDNEEDDEDMEDEDMELDEDDTQSTIDKIFEKTNKNNKIIYEIEMEDEEDFDIEDDEDFGTEDEEEFDMEDEEEFDMDMEDDEDFDCSNFSTSDYLSKHPKATISDVYDYLKKKGCLNGGDGNIGENYNYLGEAKKTSKFKYKMAKNGFNEKMKEGPKKMGTGKAKFNYDKSAANVDGKMKKVTTSKKQETKEASRTYGMGMKWYNTEGELIGEQVFDEKLGVVISINESLLSKISGFFKNTWGKIKSYFKGIIDRFITNGMGDLQPGEETDITIPASINKDNSGLESPNAVSEGAIEAIRGNYNEALTVKYVIEKNNAPIDIVLTENIDENYVVKVVQLDADGKRYIPEVENVVKDWDKKLRAD